MKMEPKCQCKIPFSPFYHFYDGKLNMMDKKAAAIVKASHDLQRIIFFILDIYYSLLYCHYPNMMQHFIE